MAESLKNIGPVSWRSFKRIGINDVATLKQMGAFRVFVLVKKSEGNASLNLLYALAAG